MIDRKEAKILYFDIETSPIISYNWGVYEQNAIAVQKDWYMISFAYKWNDGAVKAYALPDFNTYKKDSSNDKELATKLWELFDEADIIVAHNGDSFDIKKANARFLAHGIKPPSPYKTVDTLKIARKHFKLTRNKLDYLGEILGVGKKIDTGGFDLWLGCLNGDESSWRKMVRYNKQDVMLLYQVYRKLLGWMTNHPNLNVLNGHSHNCPNCGGNKVQARGFSVTKIGKRKRYHCQDCGAWSQGELEKTNAVVR